VRAETRSHETLAMTRGIYHRRWTSIRAVISRNDDLERLIFSPFADRTGFARPAKLSFLIIRRKFPRYRERELADKSVRLSPRFVKLWRTYSNWYQNISKYFKCLYSRMSFACRNCTESVLHIKLWAKI